MFQFIKKLINKQVVYKNVYTFDINANICVNRELTEPIISWLNENTQNWNCTQLSLHNPIDGDILIYRIYFYNLEELTHFKLWYKKGDL